MVKDKIIAAARTFFDSGGVKNTTMDDIARQAGISKRTLYENFKDKEELLRACVVAFRNENMASSTQVFQSSRNVVEAIIRLLKRGSEQARNQRYFLIDEIQKYYPTVFTEEVVCHRTNNQKYMEQLLEKGVNEGMFRNELNAEIVVLVFQGQVDSFSRNDARLDKYSMIDVFENMVISYLRGLCTPKGLEVLNNSLK